MRIIAGVVSPPTDWLTAVTDRSYNSAQKKIEEPSRLFNFYEKRQECLFYFCDHAIARQRKFRELLRPHLEQVRFGKTLRQLPDETRVLPNPILVIAASDDCNRPYLNKKPAVKRRVFSQGNSFLIRLSIF